MRWNRLFPGFTLAVVSAGLAVAPAHAQVLPPVPMPGQVDSALLPAQPGSPRLPALAASAPRPVAAASGALPNTYIMPSIAVLGTATSNANYGTGASSRSDQLLQLQPHLFLISDHARWQLQADLGLDALYYAQGTQASLVAPDGTASLHSDLIDQFLYFDASFDAQRQAISPYVAQGESLSGSTYTSTQWRISPYIDHLFTPSLRLQARSDDTWTQVSNTSGGTGITGGRYLDQTISLDQRPADWGYELLAQQIYATYTDQPYAWLRDTTGRVIPDYALSPQWIVGIVGGAEKVQVYGAQDNASIYGVRLQWRPRPDDGMQATVEHRFFGTGWNVQANGGTALLRFSMNWLRDIGSSLAPVGNSGDASSNVTQLLNGLLSTEYPNPLQRAQVVQALLGESGLPPGLATSGGFYTSSSLLQNSLVANALLLRTRDSFALSIYRNRIEDLFLPGQQVLSLLQGESSDNDQSGAAFNYGHRLTPLDTVNLTLQHEVDVGFGLNQGQDAHQTALIVQLDHRFSPRTIGLIGVRRQYLVSSVVGNSNESAIFAGFVHRF